MEVDAFFTNTHFNFGKAIIEQSGVSLSKDEENAFLSGLIYADIGRFEFDKKPVFILIPMNLSKK